MEISSPKDPLRQKLLLAFQLLTTDSDHTHLKAVMTLQSVCHEKNFADLFLAMSKELDQTYRMDWGRQLSALMSGVRDLGAPFPELLHLMIQMGTPPDGPGDEARRLITIMQKMISRDQILAVGSFPAMFDMYENASEQGRAKALPELLETIVKFNVTENFQAKVLHLMGTFTAAWAATAWMYFVKNGGSLVKPEHHRRAAQAFLSCTPNETWAARTLDWLLCIHDKPDSQIFTPPEQQAMLERLVTLHQWSSLISQLDTYRAPQVCALLFTNADLAFWVELRDTYHVRRVARVLASARKEIKAPVEDFPISRLIEHCITSREKNLHVIQELMRGMCDERYIDSDDWDNLLTLVELLIDSKGATELCLTLSSCLWELDLFSYQRKLRLVNLCANWEPDTKLHFLVRLIAGVKGHVGPTMWDRVLSTAKASSLNDMNLVKDLVSAAFAQSSTRKSAPKKVAIALLELLAASAFTDYAAVLVGETDISVETIEWLQGTPSGRTALLKLLKNPETMSQLLSRITRIAPQHLHDTLTNVKDISPTTLLFGLCEVMVMEDKPPQTAAMVVDVLRHWVALLPAPLQRIAALVLDAAAPSTHASSGPTSSDPILPGFNAPLSKVLRCIHLLSDDRQWAKISDSKLRNDQRNMYLAALVNAAAEGSLKSMSLDPQSHAWQKNFPKINWDHVYHGNAATLPPGRKAVDPKLITLSPEVCGVVTDWIHGMLAVVDSLLGESKDHADQRKAVVSALTPHLKPILMTLMCAAVPGLCAIDPSHIEELIRAATEGRHPARLFDNELFDRLLTKKGELAPAIAQHVQALQEAGHSLLKKAKSNEDPDCVCALAKTFAQLQQQVGQAQFRRKIKNNFGCFTIETINKDEVACLLASTSLKIDLAPWKSSGHLLAASLAGPVLFAGARDIRGALVALAMCPVCTYPEYPDQILLCDSIHLSPVCFPQLGGELSPAGQLIVDGLLEHIVNVTALVGASKPLITSQYRTWYNIPAPSKPLKIDTKQLKVVAGDDKLLLVETHSVWAIRSFYDLMAPKDLVSSDTSSSTSSDSHS